MKQMILLLVTMSLLGADFIPNFQTQVVLQPSKNLMWQDDVSSSERQMSYKSAIAYCETLDYNGISDWHIPNTVELYSLIDLNRTPTISSAFSHTYSGCYWALHDNTKSHVGIIDFSMGTQMAGDGFDRECHVRCVHSLK